MDHDEMEQGFRKLDQRVERVEQILPTLATKADLQAAIDKAVEPLATKAQLRETNAELRTAITESEHRMRTYFDVIAESLRDDIQLIGTDVATLSQRGQVGSG